MCGIFGVWNYRKAAECLYLMGHSVQHRAKEFAGIITSDGSSLYVQKGCGIVQDVFSQDDLNRLHGMSGIGHIRYSTVEDDVQRENIQPLIGPFGAKEVAIAHNGNILNCRDLISILKDPKSLKTSIDTEIVLRLFCESTEDDIVKRVFDSVRHIRGSYSLLILFDDALVAVRDPWGNRPLSLGQKDDGWFLCSESIAFDDLRVNMVRDIAPGEILIIDKSGMKSYYFDENQLGDKPISHKLCQCIFCLIYYAHPGSKIFGEWVVNFHLRAGTKLWEKCPVDADCVMGIPDSSLFHAEGVSRASGLPLVRGITRSHYIGRTFVEPNQWLRDLAVSKKFSGIRPLIDGKRVILVDDSIVRLTTMPGVVRLLRWMGAKEIHARIVAPKIVHPCYYGIDTPRREELIASRLSDAEIAEKCGLDSLCFLSITDLRTLVDNPDDYCYACMNGQYPIKK